MNRGAPVSAADGRLAWVDIARGLGIIAVVVWHTVGGIVRSGLPSPAGTSLVVDGWDVYAYRAMPVFFLVSGLCVLPSLRRPIGTFLATKARTLLWPYLLWSVISLAVGTVAGPASNYGVTLAELPRLGYDPILQYWFLYSLFAIMVVYAVLARVGVPPLAMLGLAAALYALTTLAHPLPESYVLTQTGLLAIFFAFGAAARQRIIGAVQQAPAWLLGAIAIAAVAAVGWLIAGAGLGPPPAFVPLASASVAMAGMVAIGELVARAGGPLAAGLGAIGCASLQVYLAQILFASGTRVILVRLGLTDFVLQLVLGVLAGFVGPLLLVALGHRAHVQVLWTWPGAPRAAATADPGVSGRPGDAAKDRRTPPVAAAGAGRP